VVAEHDIGTFHPVRQADGTPGAGRGLHALTMGRAATAARGAHTHEELQEVLRAVDSARGDAIGHGPPVTVVQLHSLDFLPDLVLRRGPAPASHRLGGHEDLLFQGRLRPWRR
jgi:hypothetical protein